jgi:hypothetical protein
MPQSVVVVGLAQSLCPRKQFYTKLLISNTVVLAPIPLDIRGISIFTSRIDIGAAFTVQWMTQVAEIGASQGIYDHLRKAVLFGPGPYQFHLKNFNSQNWGTPVSVEDVPPRLLVPLDERLNPGLPPSEMSLAMVKNMPQSDPKDAPDLDLFIFSEEIVDEAGNDHH